MMVNFCSFYYLSVISIQTINLQNYELQTLKHRNHCNIHLMVRYSLIYLYDAQYTIWSIDFFNIINDYDIHA